MTLLSPGTAPSAHVATVDVHAPPCILIHHLLPLPLPSTVIRCLGLASTVGAHVKRRRQMLSCGLQGRPAPDRMCSLRA